MTKRHGTSLSSEEEHKDDHKASEEDIDFEEEDAVDFEEDEHED